MRKKIRQYMAGIIATVTLFTAIPFENAYAAQPKEIWNNIATDEEVKVTTESIEVDDEMDADTNAQGNTEENIIEEQPIVQEKEYEPDLLNYVVVDVSDVEIGEEQNIVLDLGDGSSEITSATLFLHRVSDGKIVEVRSALIDGSGIQFVIEYLSQEDTGVYALDSLEYTKEQEIYSIAFLDIGMNVQYGVNTNVDIDADAKIVDGVQDELLMDESIVTFDENGNQISQNSMADAIEAATDGVGIARYNGKISVVLDPGHGGSDGGASRTINGKTYCERDINLKIAQYCKTELETYGNVVVYMTRTDNTSDCMSREERAKFAADRSANVLVSLHINSTKYVMDSANGSMVYYPNANYNAIIGQQGHDLGEQILSQLKDLGLKNNGATFKDASNDKYPDGSASDYMGINSWCKRMGFPGIIVEHAFVNNESDAVNFLSTDNQLQALGIADATGIAKYYGLQKGYIYNGIDYSTVFDPDYYGMHYPELATIYNSDSKLLLEHFVKYGIEEGRQGCASFSIASYKARYADLRAVFGNDLMSYYIHYINYGKAEGRIATGDVAITTGVTIYQGVDYSTVYDYSYYIANNPDVAALYPNDDVSVLAHFINYGMAENRQGSALFNAFSYYLANADLRQVYRTDWKSYYMHYINYGKKEGRKGTGTTTLLNPLTVYNGVDYSSVYSYAYYTTKYADVRNAYGANDAAVLEHFVRYGMAEGRQGNASFNVLSYYFANRDLRQAYGNRNYEQYYMHYIYYGKKEGRKGTGTTTLLNPLTVYNGVDYSSVYNYNYYQAKYADIAKTFPSDDVSTLAHFVQYGMSEGRQAIANFNVDIYRRNYEDLNNLYGNSLQLYYVHFMNYGKAEGRNASTEIYTTIMRDSTTSVTQMVNYFNSKGMIYPMYYANTEAATIQQFCQIYYNECLSEGIDPAVAFAQSMMETAFLKFTGRVPISAYNFAGIGAVDNNVAAYATFSSITLGVRAHVQHLKAYATTAALNNECVDPRYSLVRKGTAPYVEWLGISENPSGTGWATEKNYGYSIKNDYIAKLYTY